MFVVKKAIGAVTSTINGQVMSHSLTSSESNGGIFKSMTQRLKTDLQRSTMIFCLPFFIIISLLLFWPLKTGRSDIKDILISVFIEQLEIWIKHHQNDHCCHRHHQDTSCLPCPLLTPITFSELLRTIPESGINHEPSLFSD